MRTLWWSNSPWTPSGYGNQTALFAPRINAIHPTAIFAFVGLQGGVMEWEGLRVYPRIFDRYGNDSVSSHAQHWQADVVISHLDAIMVQPGAFRGLPWVPWFPIDTDAIRPKEIPILKQAFQPIVQTRHAEGVAREAGLDPRYVPAGVDTTIYCPGDQLAARESIKLPTDRYIVGMVAANQGRPSRKAFPEQLQAFAEFHKRHDDAFLYIHSWLGEQLQGANLLRMLGDLGLKSGRDWMTAPDYLYISGLISQEEMARIYRSIDVLMNVSWGEGFGVPILESQACGTPVIVGDWTAMSELCFAGWKVDKSNAQRVWNNFDSWQYSARPGAIVDQLEEAYRAQGDPTNILKARRGAMDYDADRVMSEHWTPVLAEIEAKVVGEAGKLEMVRL